jgi:hypothetical protein
LPLKRPRLNDKQSPSGWKPEILMDNDGYDLIRKRLLAKLVTHVVPSLEILLCPESDNFLEQVKMQFECRDMTKDADARLWH